MTEESVWSDEARALFRPFRTYRDLAQGEPVTGWRVLLRRPILYLLLLGAFVSLSAAGRLVSVHVFSTAIFWSFAPFLQMAAVALLARLLAPRRGVARAVDLHFVGQGPWLLTLFALVAICLFAPRVYDTFVFLLGTGVLPGMLVLTMLWSMVLTVAFFRSGLSLSWAKTGLATILYYGLYGGSIVAYYLATDQLQPLLRGGSNA
jgi:hypothetical protein